MAFWLCESQSVPLAPALFKGQQHLQIIVLFSLWTGDAYMQMIDTHVWPGHLSTAGQHASGDFAGAFLAPIFKWLGYLPVILVTLSVCDILPLQRRCSAKVISAIH